MNTTPDRFSRRVRDLHPSPIRQILAVAGREGMISFAGGLPAPSTFAPVDLRAMPTGWLQYGPTEGEPALRACIAEEVARTGLACTPEQVLVLSGSQQGIDLVAKLFIDPGTAVLVESPTYLAALQVFRFFGARLSAIAPGHPLRDAGGETPAFAYVAPTFQNPTGRCYAQDERRALARDCEAAGVVLFEDDPYRDLAYEACDRTPICASLQRGSWIYQGSFSKTFAPGVRLGFLVASADLIGPLTHLKQGADLHSNRLSQWLVLQQLHDGHRAERLAGIVESYRHKRDAFARALECSLRGLATWNVPEGGLFFWLTLSEPADTRALLALGIERGIAFMPGEPFFPDPETAPSSLRLNFSHASESQARQGLDVLADLLRTAVRRA